MEPTSPQKHAVSLGDRLNRKIEEDASAVVSVTQEKLNKLADDSTRRLSASLNTTITDIENHLNQSAQEIENKLASLRRYTTKTWLFLVIGATGLTLGMLVGLGLYGRWELDQVRHTRQELSTLRAELAHLPKGIRIYQANNGKWYLVAPQIKAGLVSTYQGRKDEAAQIIP
jgi:hypothetical protein